MKSGIGLAAAASERMRSPASFSASALTLVLTATTAFGQNPPERVPTLGTRAEVVLVDVIVTDKRGQPVTNLSREDFLVFEDGRPVEIVAFRAPGAAAAPAAEAAASREAAESPAVRPAGDPGTVVLYVDNAVLTSAGRRQALEGIRSFVGDRLSSGGFRALVISEGRGTKVLTTVTTSVEDVGTALDAIGATSAAGVLARSEERLALNTMRDLIELYKGDCMQALDQCIGLARAHAESRSFQLSRTLDRLSRVVGALGALPGRKALVYVSEGLEQRPGIHLFHQIGEICPEALSSDATKMYGPMQEYDASRALRELAARANAARVTFYPLDARGLQGHSIADPSVGERRYVASARNDSIREANLRAPPEILAQETGGFAIIGTNDPSRTLARVPDELAARYDLGFAPAREPDGRSHSIEVRLRGKGLRLRHRTSYLHADQEARQADRTMAALLFGIEEDRLGATVSADLVPASERREAGRVAAVRISVPLSGLATEPDGDGRRARLRLVIAVRKVDATTESAPDIREKDVAIRMPSKDAEGPEAGRHDFVVEVPLGEGEHEIAVGVHDALSSQASYCRLRVN